MDAWKPNFTKTEDLSRTMYNISLGIQTVQGYVRQEQLWQALGRYDYMTYCEDCTYAVGEAQRALEREGQFERDVCYPEYLYVR